MAKTITVDLLDSAGKKAGTTQLPADVFGVEPNIPLIHQVVVAQQAAARQGTHATKTRGMVAGGGRKPYRQKGTGRARQGSIRAPQFAGGGIVHGPQPRDYSQRTPRKMKAAALRGALSDRARAGRVHVIERIVEGAPSTKAALAAVRAVVGDRSALVVLERSDDVALKSLRNIAGLHVLQADQLNTYDVLVHDDIIFTSGALQTFLGSSPAKAKAAPAKPETAPTKPEAAPAKPETAPTKAKAAPAKPKVAEVKS